MNEASNIFRLIFLCQYVDELDSEYVNNRGSLHLQLIYFNTGTYIKTQHRIAYFVRIIEYVVKPSKWISLWLLWSWVLKKHIKIYTFKIYLIQILFNSQFSFTMKFPFSLLFTIYGQISSRWSFIYDGFSQI